MEYISLKIIYPHSNPEYENICAIARINFLESKMKEKIIDCIEDKDRIYDFMIVICKEIILDTIQDIEYEKLNRDYTTERSKYEDKVGFSDNEIYKAIKIVKATNGYGSVRAKLYDFYRTHKHALKKSWILPEVHGYDTEKEFLNSGKGDD